MKYSVIYADPPWQYKTWSNKGTGRSADQHYPVMGVEDIKAMTVSAIAADDCVLFMWVTYPTLPQALEVLKAWGFDFKTVAFTWVKRNKKSPGWFWGLGHWTRANGEICILATKGKPKRVSKAVHSVIDSPVRAHSQKPDEARERIVKLMGDVPRIELFARERSSGWHSWGNEVECDIQLLKSG